MDREYDIIIEAKISISGKYTADSLQEAIDTAKGELRSQGEISDVIVERSVCLFETDDVPAAKPWFR